MYPDARAESLRHGRVILIGQGANWPGWAINYRSLRLSDNVVAQGAAESVEVFALRVRHTADELRCMGLAVEEVFVSLPPPGARDSVRAAIVAAAAGGAMQSGRVVLLCDVPSASRERKELGNLQRELERQLGDRNLQVQLRHPATDTRARAVTDGIALQY